MKYAAIINTPGYLPWADWPEEFDTASDAWAFLASERRALENTVEGDDYSEAVITLEAYALAGHGEDVVYAPTPGHYGHPDLGLVYSVTKSTTLTTKLPG